MDKRYQKTGEPSKGLSFGGLPPLLLWSAAILIWLWVGHDGRLHWDEPGYLYTAAYVPWAQILGEGFEPSGITGFNISRLGHIAILKSIAAVTGPGPDLVFAVTIVYLLFLLALPVVSYYSLQRLMPGARGLAQGNMLALFAPMSVYLAFKTGPDVPALLFCAIACLCFLQSLQKPRAFGWVLLTAVFLTMTGLTKFVQAWMFISLAGTLLAFGGYRWSFWSVLWRAVVAGVVSLLLFGGSLFVLGIPLAEFLSFLSVAGNNVEPAVATLFKMGLAYGLLALLLPVALLSPERKWKLFLIGWLGLATVPFLIVLSKIEVRYLIPGFIPLAGLMGLAFNSIEAWLFNRQWSLLGPRAVGAIAIVLLAITAALVQPLTEHEVRTDQFRTAVRQIQADAGDQSFSILLPWEYTDFHYLRVAYPALNAYSIHTKKELAPAALQDWERFQDEYYSDRILHNLEEVSALDGLIYYMGFEFTFPVENLQQLLSYWPGENLRETALVKIQSISPLNHLEKSWMWQNPNVELQPFSRVGHYQLFKATVVNSNLNG